MADLEHMAEDALHSTEGRKVTDEAVQKAGDVADAKTGDKYDTQVDSAEHAVEQRLEQ